MCYAGIGARVILPVSCTCMLALFFGVLVGVGPIIVEINLAFVLFPLNRTRREMSHLMHAICLYPMACLLIIMTCFHARGLMICQGMAKSCSALCFGSVYGF